ncbi:hypothetical protein ABBQ38_001629 [Trebouxia sp. C0009 RCD-2024]
MRCLHTGPPALPATFDCRRPLLLHTRRQDRRGRDATPRLASQTPHSADVEHAPKKVSMVSLGCPKNTVDGEVILGDLFRSGFDIVDDHEDADAIVVNTCSFVEEAKTESLEAIMQAAQLKADGKAQRVIVTGCLAQRYSQDLAEQLPEADMVMGFQNYSSLPRHLRGMLGLSPELDSATYSGASRTQVGEATVNFRPEYDRHRLTPHHTAYLRVAEGCNHACTFCAIPGFR